MNIKKILAILCWALAFLFPARLALLETEEVNNIPGLVAFVAFVVLLFAGYFLMDSSYTKKTDHGSGHH